MSTELSESRISVDCESVTSDDPLSGKFFVLLLHLRRS